MNHYHVAPNSLDNRIRRYLKRRHRRTVIVESHETYLSMDRIVYRDLRQKLRFGRVLAETELGAKDVVGGEIVCFDPSPSFQGYQHEYLKLIANGHMVQTPTSSGRMQATVPETVSDTQGDYAVS